MKKQSQAKRLLVDHLLLAFAHYQDGEFEESAKIMQQASEISDVTDVVDEINEDHKQALHDDGEGGGDGDAGTDSGSSNEVLPDDDDIGEMDDDHVQASIAKVAEALKVARAAAKVTEVRKCSRKLYKLHARSRELKAAAEAAVAAAKPVDRQARALANVAKLAKK